MISEIVAGILIGPSALGQIVSYRNALFPAASLSYINLVAQFGLIFFLFLVGLELDPRVMMRNLKNTLIIATIQKVLCFAVSALVALVLLGERTGKSKEFSYGLFFLFLSVAISITVSDSGGLGQVTFSFTGIPCIGKDPIRTKLTEHCSWNSSHFFSCHR